MNNQHAIPAGSQPTERRRVKAARTIETTGYEIQNERQLDLSERHGVKSTRTTTAKGLMKPNDWELRIPER